MLGVIALKGAQWRAEFDWEKSKKTTKQVELGGQIGRNTGGEGELHRFMLAGAHALTGECCRSRPTAEILGSESGFGSCGWVG